MKHNPCWLDIDLADYETRLGHPNVAQLQTLNKIYREQYSLVPKNIRHRSTVAVLGVAGGNGLEYAHSYGHIIGIDINAGCLKTNKEHFPALLEKLELRCADLAAEPQIAAYLLDAADLILANLVIAHIHLECFAYVLELLSPHERTISCVIQQTPDGEAASRSGYEHTHAPRLSIPEEVSAQSLIQTMRTRGYLPVFEQTYPLPNGKKLVRIDFFSEKQA